jgi:hypothetical protein
MVRKADTRYPTSPPRAVTGACAPLYRALSLVRVTLRDA